MNESDSQLVRLIRGEINVDEYIADLKRRVDQMKVDALLKARATGGESEEQLDP